VEDKVKVLNVDNFLEESIKLLFDDSLRTCPIPKNLKSKVKSQVEKKFTKWYNSLPGDQFLNNFDIFRMVVHKLYDLVEEETRALLESKEDCIIYKFPKLPRKGDTFSYGKKKAINEIVDRQVIMEGNRWKAIKVLFKFPDEDGSKETEFELRD
jgi:hypothetical protein